MAAFESDSPLGCAALELLPKALALLQAGAGCRWLGAQYSLLGTACPAQRHSKCLLCSAQQTPTCTLVCNCLQAAGGEVEVPNGDGAAAACQVSGKQAGPRLANLAQPFRFWGISSLQD